ncbi:MAG: agmatinase [Candidatus Azobacteroides sp.]|nr:agmatinase [Candidatus Azobacteroides sp.]
MENFAGLDAGFSDYEKSKIVVLPVPYDATSTWVKGADKGPEALLEASVALEWYDIETKSQVYLQGIHTAASVTEDKSPDLLCNEVENRLLKIISDKKFPVTIGGNHTVSVGAFRAMAKTYEDLTILQLDAHSDLRKFYEGSELNHACVMHRAKDLTQITQVGIRSMSDEETYYYDPHRIFFAHEMQEERSWSKKALKTLSKNVYITIDLDVFDPGIMPSTGTPEPGGLNYYEVLHFLRSVIENRNVVGFDVVELCPNLYNKAPDFMAARLIYQLLTYKFIGVKPA